MENQAVKPPMILIVESDPLLLTGMSAILDQKGYRCFLARNHLVGQKATLAMTFDLIIFSFDSNPLEAAMQVAEVRGHDNTRDLPVLFLASRYENAWIEPLNRAGGVYCLPKPFDPEVLLDLVEKALCLPHLAVAKTAPPKAHFAKDWVRLT
jgi:chemosensory pili system protein ChpA (sensor histidine kinase/response regulator)